MVQEFLRVLDSQIRPYAPRIVDDVRLSYDDANSLATTIADEIKVAGNQELLDGIRDSSPLNIKRRLFFFEDFQIWLGVIEPTLDFPAGHRLPTERVQNAFHEMLGLVKLYVNIVFVADGLFEVLAKKGPKPSCVRKCSRYIRENPLRAFRNAVAHGNWYLTHTGAVKYWARKGAGTDPCPTCGKHRKDDPLTEFLATDDDMNFYLALTRCVAWTSLLTAAEQLGEGKGGIENV